MREAAEQAPAVAKAAQPQILEPQLVAISTADESAVASPPQILFRCRTIKRFNLWYHDRCVLTITTAGIEFIDPKNSRYDFNIPASQLRNASIYDHPASVDDLELKLADGGIYRIDIHSKSDKAGG